MARALPIGVFSEPQNQDYTLLIQRMKTVVLSQHE